MKPPLITDEQFLEWCGTHMVKGCGKTREMEGCDREVSICEDCRAKAQRDICIKHYYDTTDTHNGSDTYEPIFTY